MNETAPLKYKRLLLKLSGVPLLEKTITSPRPKYREYIESTPAFFPRLPFLGSRR